MQRSSVAMKWCWFVAALVLLSGAGFWRARSSAVAAEDSRYFAETGFSVSGIFLGYWQERGGLFSYGYPISEVMQQDGMRVQYFERARFEYHPENAGSPYEVLLTPLGNMLTVGRNFPAAVPIDGHEFFPQTHHNMLNAFSDYWHSQGGLARFGYPISEELTERSQLDGQTYTVQYFERARFEYHPENSAPYDVLLGQLGKQWLQFRTKAASMVQVMGRKLVLGPDLSPFKMEGFNYFPRDYAWSDFEQWPAERVKYELDEARNLGANTLRVFIRYDAFGGPAAKWSQQDGFRRFVALAKERGFHLVVGLFDSYRKAPYADWDSWPEAGSPGEALDKAYLAAIVPNYRDETAIATWDVYNEPDYVNTLEYQWDAHRQNRIDWLARMSAEVRRLDPNHLLTVGVALAGSNSLTIASGLSVLDMVDVVSVHYYARNYHGESLGAVLDDLKRTTRKPIMVEELGQATFEGQADGSGDDAAQAAFIGSAMRDANDAGTSGLLLWTLYDFPQHADNPEGHYGLFRADDSPKPAVQVFSNYNH